MPVIAFFSRVYNPLVDDYDAILASSAPRVVVGATYFSPTAVRLDFAPRESAVGYAVTNAAATLPPYIKPPKRR